MPLLVFVGFLKRHKFAKAFCMRKFLEELIHLIGIGKARRCLLKQIYSFLVKSCKLAKVGGFLFGGYSFIGGDKPLFYQYVKVNKIWITAESGVGFVGRIIFIGQAEGKHLPICKPAVGEEVYPFLSCRAESTLGVFTPKGGNVHKHAT